MRLSSVALFVGCLGGRAGTQLPGVQEAPFQFCTLPPAHPCTQTQQEFFTCSACVTFGTCDRKVNAIHMALIPKGQHRGKLLVWEPSKTDCPTALPWKQAWYIVDPVARTMVAPPPIDMPQSGGLSLGDIMCSGHAWMPDGRLFVAGGTRQYCSGGHAKGCKLVYIYDPSIGAYGTWTEVLPGLERDRWYPSVTLVGDYMVVSGGTADSGCGGPGPFPDDNSYEVYHLPSSAWRFYRSQPPVQRSFPGSNRTAGELGQYPRIVMLSTGALIVAGFWQGTERLAYPPDGVLFPNDPWVSHMAGQLEFRGYGTAVLLPNLSTGPTGLEDMVAAFGGGLGSGTAIQHAQRIKGTDLPSASLWTSLPNMLYPRAVPNATLLPDGTVVMTGGVTDIGAPVLSPEQLVNLLTGPAWIKLAPEDSTRDYHATALLLPDGRLISAGGEGRTWDFQILKPPYLTVTSVARPAWVTPPTLLPIGVGTVDATYDVSSPEAPLIAKVVLMRPGSVTHHFNFDQRYVQLAFTQNVGTLTITRPTNEFQTPKGYWMLFLISTDGLPSNAAWVEVQ